MVSTKMCSGFCLLAILSSALLISGCKNSTGSNDDDEKMQLPGEVRHLEEEVEQLFSLAPCSASHGYCSFPHLIERVDALISVYCTEGRSSDAHRIFTDFDHFVDPSPQRPDC